MRGLRLFPILASTMLVACSDGTGPTTPSEPVYSRIGEMVFDTAVDGLSLQLEHPGTVRRGESMPLRLTVANTTSGPLTLAYLAHGPSDDYVVTRPDSTIVWELRYGDSWADAARFVTLESGETLEFTHTWNLRAIGGRSVPAGRYHVRGVYLGHVEDPDATEAPPKLWTSPAPFDIVDP